MVKYLIIGAIIGAIIGFMLSDINPVKDWITQRTGKTPYDWGLDAGKATRKFFEGEKNG